LLATESDAAFLETFSDALTAFGKAGSRTRSAGEIAAEKNAGLVRLFELANAYATAGQDAKSVDLLQTLKRAHVRGQEAKRVCREADNIGESIRNRKRFWNSGRPLYNEMNREAQYLKCWSSCSTFTWSRGTCRRRARRWNGLWTLTRTITGTSSDSNCCAGKADDTFLQRVSGRLAKSSSGGAPQPRQPQPAGGIRHRRKGGTSEAGQSQALEDLIVQTEIFIQYSLHAKAQERLQKIASQFPGEEEKNARLRESV